MKRKSLKKAALDYHAKGRPGKIEVIPTKETTNQRALSLAYSPGVAEPCLRIAQNPEDVYKYTAKGNLVAVISNGTAVLGLGDIGPEASKPVMEGKSLLFKVYADIDCFDLELDTMDVDELVRTIKILEPTFGGINLEDFSAPMCFELEERLKEEMNIPVMHDDQHGTAIISSAALMNALEIVEKDIDKVKIVVAGAGAAAMSCIRFWIKVGVKLENIFMFDEHGQLSTDREDLDDYRRKFAKTPTYNSIAEALVGADVFLGLSVGNIVKKKDLKGMNDKPIIFALANPTPEISYNDAKEARPDCVMATGRSDFPNQVNNVLGFPYIFRGALDVKSSEINEEMKMGAVKALAELAKKPVPDIVNIAYNNADLRFGPDYFIPKPVDPRLISTVAPMVAKAAMESGVATQPIEDWAAYEAELERRMGLGSALSKIIETKAKHEKMRIVFSDADNLTVLKAIQVVIEDDIAEPILLGDRKKIEALCEEYNVMLYGSKIINPRNPITEDEEMKLSEYTERIYNKMNRRGFTKQESEDAAKSRIYYGISMVKAGDADAMIGGYSRKYPDIVRPALQIIGSRNDVSKVAGLHILDTANGPLFLADTTINHELSAENIADITELVAKEVRQFNVEPKIAMVTYSNFGSVPKGESAVLMKQATKIVQERHPEWKIDGEMQAHLALDPEIRKQYYPFSKLGDERANVLIFPNLSSANIAYNLIGTLTNSVNIIGPVLLGLKKPIHVLQMGVDAKRIVDMVGIAAIHAQELKKG